MELQLRTNMINRLFLEDHDLHNLIRLFEETEEYELMNNVKYQRIMKNQDHDNTYVTDKTKDILIEILDYMFNKINRHIMCLPSYDEVYQSYQSSGSCIIGSCLYSYKIPSHDNRKRKAVKARLYNFGFLNGSIGEERKGHDIIRYLKDNHKINKILFDYGSMD